MLWALGFYNTELRRTHTIAVQSNAEFLALSLMPLFLYNNIACSSSHMVDQFNTHTIYHTFFPSLFQ